MAKRRSKRKPLEWRATARLITATEADAVNSTIELGLRDDEVAEIHKIEIDVELVPATTTTALRADWCLSMDPDIDDSPTAVATNEDLEVFHKSSFIGAFLQAVADVDELVREDYHLDEHYDPPVLVGTDVGLSSRFTFTTANGSGAIIVRIFFTRRKASVEELNQVLLKRR